MQAYEESGDFDYMTLVIQPPSIWQRLQWWFLGLISNLLSNPNTPWLTELIFYGILILVLGGAVFYIVRLKYGGALSTDYKSYQTNVQSLQNVKVEDFDGMIKAAIQEKNYKLAIRYVYLQSLTLLSQKDLIKLKDWKSPYDYEKELSEDLAIPYRDLSRLFEYVWYGDFDAGEEEYNRGSALANQVNKG
jgi:hypothetical protein